METSREKLPRVSSGRRRQDDAGGAASSSEGRSRRASATEIVELATMEAAALSTTTVPKRAGVGMQLPSLVKRESGSSDIGACASRSGSTHSSRGRTRELEYDGSSGVLATLALPPTVHRALIDDDEVLCEEVSEDIIQSFVRDELRALCRREVKSFVDLHQLPSDGLSLVEHLVMDIVEPVAREECHMVAKAALKSMAQEYVEKTRAERVYSELLQHLIVDYSSEIAELAMLEHRVEVMTATLVTEGVNEMIQEVTRQCFSEAKDVSGDMKEIEDYALVNAHAADQIVYGIMFKHMLAISSTRALLWDFEDFCANTFVNKLMGEAALRHMQVVQQCVLEKPYWGEVRDGVVGQVAGDHLIEQLQLTGSQPPPDPPLL